MPERCDTVDVSVRWEPNAPDAHFLVRDFGDAVLALDPHPDDPDQRCVVLSWPRSRAASMGSPNDEALTGHRLYGHGLAGLSWIGIVRDSELIADLERRNRVHDRHDPARFGALTHDILPLKENVVEVVALELMIGRVRGSAREAVLAVTDQTDG